MRIRTMPTHEVNHLLKLNNGRCLSFTMIFPAWTTTTSGEESLQITRYAINKCWNRDWKILDQCEERSSSKVNLGWNFLTETHHHHLHDTPPSSSVSMTARHLCMFTVTFLLQSSVQDVYVSCVCSVFAGFRRRHGSAFWGCAAQLRLWIHCTLHQGSPRWEGEVF